MLPVPKPPRRVTLLSPGGCHVTLLAAAPKFLPPHLKPPAQVLMGTVTQTKLFPLPAPLGS